MSNRCFSHRLHQQRHHLQIVVLLLPAVACWLQQSSSVLALQQQQQQWPAADACSSEAQLIQCGLMPFQEADQNACCELYAANVVTELPSLAPKTVKAAGVAGLHPTAAAAAAAAAAAEAAALLPDNAVTADDLFPSTHPSTIANSTGSDDSSSLVDDTPPASSRPDLSVIIHPAVVIGPGSDSNSNSSSSSSSSSSDSNSNSGAAVVAAAKLQDLYNKGCLQQVLAVIPKFSDNDTSSEQINSNMQAVPVLSKALIQNIKAAALDQLVQQSRSLLNPADYWSLSIRSTSRSRTTTTTTTTSGSSSSSSTSDGGFKHPGGSTGAAELALMQQRLAQGSPTQSAALHNLITGDGTSVKVYFGPKANWTVPSGTHTSYEGPYPMPVLLARYGGINDVTGGSICPFNYPAGDGAPQELCGHISLVELDAQEAYRQAVAFAATGDARHAEVALKILDGWSSTNKVFGVVDGNGALEAAWACASMSRAMELLLSFNSTAVSGSGSGSSNGSSNGSGNDSGSDSGSAGSGVPWTGVSEASLQQFAAWVGETLMPVMDTWVAIKTPPQQWVDDGNMLANWHASISDCWMTFGVLAGDKVRYDKAVALFHSTVKGYFKWGRGRYSRNRLVGESTETLRDIYHTLFGLGSLLLGAETAWQQDEDIYSSNQHVLAAAMEVHAKIINAGKNESQLPLNFRFFESMPPPPPGCVWRINLGSQLWMAVNQTTGAWVSDLRDGYKYVLGSKYLPTAWELGYNHFAGRLGLLMPETARLLQANWPEHYTFCWGLTTLTHANSAAVLWQPGLTEQAVCTSGTTNRSTSIAVSSGLVAASATDSGAAGGALGAALAGGSAGSSSHNSIVATGSNADDEELLTVADELLVLPHMMRTTAGGSDADADDDTAYDHLIDQLIAAGSSD